jgi:hypothetical protein
MWWAMDTSHIDIYNTAKQAFAAGYNVALADKFIEVMDKE